ncbi:MAG TPA: DUF6164 family protein [Wenzhouxiangellaceae bacterium]|nr:DUF6164 family protein [Wenzhouxiangellaceae bacterium]
MTKRLLSLRGVTPEETEGLREALEAAGVEFYEIPPTAFGISAGSIWIRREDEFERAKKVFDAFQDAYVVSAREEYTPESLWSYARRNPARVAAYTAAALGVLLVMFWPVLQLWI